MKPHNQVNVVLADDHEIFRIGLKQILEDEDTIKVINMVSNGEDLLSSLTKRNPDIVILDLEMPVMNGYDAMRFIAEHYPKLKVIILSTHYSEFFVANLLQLGARSYVAKNKTDTLVKTVLRVHQDGFYFNRKISSLVISASLEEEKFKVLLKQIPLTDRELEVLKLICDELSNKAIGKALSIAEDTVEFHRKNIYKKTSASNIISLVKYAIKNGITNTSTNFKL